MKDIIVKDANTNNLNNINIEIHYGKLTVCAGPSGSGKSSFAFDTLVNKKNCIFMNYPSNVKAISQRIYSTKEKMNAIYRLEGIEKSLIVIDEPLAGMMSNEANKVSSFIKKLAQDNYVVVVEHRIEIFSFADNVLVFGPSSGTDGGNIVDVISGNEYLKRYDKVNITRKKNISNKRISATYSNFSNINNYKVEILLNTITCVTGPIGSGKSTYLKALYNAFDKSSGANERRENLTEIKNKSCIRRPHIIDASPVSKNSRSTVASYYGISKFFKDTNMNLTVIEALELYHDNPLIVRRLKHLSDIGLDYLKLNQNSYTLSGGECQRIKLAKLLCKKLGDRSIYIFDNPVRGLGQNNITKIMLMFDKLVKKNNTVLIAENDPTALLYVDNIIRLDNK